MDVGELKDEVDRITWFHSIDLGNGIVTPGVDRSARRLKGIHMPASLAGKSVLDVGTFDGFYAFEAERRGGKVVATDTAVWRNPDIGRHGFDLARRVLGSSVEDREVDVHDLSPETVGVFDLVLFLGVLYHLPNPLLALERVASVTGHHLIMETAVDLLFARRPAAAFYPTDELSYDTSNWWGPNLAAPRACSKRWASRGWRSSSCPRGPPDWLAPPAPLPREVPGDGRPAGSSRLPRLQGRLTPCPGSVLWWPA